MSLHKCLFAPSKVLTSSLRWYPGVFVLMYPSSISCDNTSLAWWSIGLCRRKWWMVPLSLPHTHFRDSAIFILWECSASSEWPLQSLLSIMSTFRWGMGFGGFVQGRGNMECVCMPSSGRHGHEDSSMSSRTRMTTFKDNEDEDTSFCPHEDNWSSWGQLII